MDLFENSLKLRGVLGSDAEVSSTEEIDDDSYAVLTLDIESGRRKKHTDEWVVRILRLRIVCPGPDLYCAVRDMKRGDYIQVEGEIDVFDEDRLILSDGKRLTAKRQVYGLRALQVRKLQFIQGGD